MRFWDSISNVCLCDSIQKVCLTAIRILASEFKEDLVIVNYF